MCVSSFLNHTESSRSVNYISIFIVIVTSWKNRSSTNLGVWNCR